MKTQRTVAVQNKAEAFELKIPTDMASEPKWTVELPRGHTALIYEHVTFDPAQNAPAGREISCYRGVVMTRHGFTHRLSGSPAYTRTGVHTFGALLSDKLDVEIWLRGWVKELAPRKRTTKIDETWEGDDD